MAKIIQNYPQSVAISASNITEARNFAKSKGYNVSSVESSALPKDKRKAFFGTVSNVYMMLKK